MSDPRVSVGRSPGPDPRDFALTITARRARGRGVKTLQLRHFHWSHATRAWSVEPNYHRILDNAPDPQTGVRDALAHAMSRRGARLSGNRNCWPVSKGFDLPIAVGSVIFDALREAGQHDVDIDRLKAVVSQYGSRITQLTTVTAEQRRHAAGALYADIARHCATNTRSASG